MRRILFLCFSGLLAAGAALAEDFWVNKEYMQWSDAEVKKLMTNSPWAKEITLNAPLAALGSRGQRPSAPASPAATNLDVENPGGGGRGRRGGGAGGDSDSGGGGGSQALLTLNISWRSALPLRKALVRSRLGNGATAIPAEAQQLIAATQEEYVIVVSGVPATMARGIQDPVLMEKSTIRVGKKPPISARAIDIQPRTQTAEVVYIFPKTQPITPEDKEVEVVLQLGAIEAKKKFSLKEMLYNGKLEL